MTYTPHEKPIEVIRRIDGAAGNWVALNVDGTDPRRTADPLLIVPDYSEFVIEMFGMEGPSADTTWADSGVYGLWCPGQEIPSDLGRIPYNTQAGNMSVPIAAGQVILDRDVYGWTQDHAGAGSYMVRLRGKLILRRDFQELRIPRPNLGEQLLALFRGG